MHSPVSNASLLRKAAQKFLENVGYRLNAEARMRPFATKLRFSKFFPDQVATSLLSALATPKNEIEELATPAKHEETRVDFQP